MKKIISILAILLILCGCANNNIEQCISKLDLFFANYQSTSNTHGKNNNTNYYSFYLPSDIQEIEYNDTYHHFIFNSSDFVMNLNINSILCENIFLTEPSDPFSFLSQYAVYEHDNLSSENVEHYKFCLYKIENDYYFSLYTNKLNFFGKVYLNEAEELVKHLFVLNNSTQLDKEKIIDAYYMGITIDYTQPELELVGVYVPKEGSLSDLVEKEESENEPKESDEIEGEENSNIEE